MPTDDSSLGPLARGARDAFRAPVGARRYATGEDIAALPRVTLTPEQEAALTGAVEQLADLALARFRRMPLG